MWNLVGHPDKNNYYAHLREDLSVGDDGTRLRTSILLLIPPFAVVDNPLFNAFVRKIAESRNAAWYFAPQSLLTALLHR
jgi:hypothetical protein